MQLGRLPLCQLSYSRSSCGDGTAANREEPTIGPQIPRRRSTQSIRRQEGIGRIQARGGAVVEIRSGDTVHTPPGEWHWHGAAPDRFMTHLAIFEASVDGTESEWARR